MDDSDLASALTGLAGALRVAGIPANTARVITSSDAVTAFPNVRADQLYWATRLSFCAQRADIPVFDSVFRAWFGLVPVDASRLRAEAAGTTTAEEEQEPATDTPGEGSSAPAAAAGTAEALWIRDMGKLTAEERAEVNRLIARLAVLSPHRPSLRCVPGGRYRIDVDRTVRSTFQRAGEPVRLCYRHRTAVPQRLLLLVDVSGSMAEYADAFLRFGHAVLRAWGDAAEVFTLGTRFARATVALRQHDPDQAMRAASRIDPARGSGTRLGPALSDFLHRWSGHRAVRSATVVIASDGWESGRPDLLERQVARLKLLSHRLIWVNPQAGAPNFKLRAPGLKKVRPLIDDHIPGHSPAALQSLAKRIADIHDD
jgi:uncharacterized protein with von Willebrand factor type A (vWA) domain